MKTLTTKGGRIECEQFGPVCCKRYIGHFMGPRLQDKAATGMWYTFVQGQPYAVQGEGATPRDAIRDAANRTRERINALNQALQTLTVAAEGA